MALINILSICIILVALVFAWLSAWWFPLSYIAAGLQILLFCLWFVSIPLNLNWSANLYRHLFFHYLVVLASTLLIFAICYYRVGFVSMDDSGTPTIGEALYFSITTFTTVQYGEYQPTPESRFLVALESLLALTAFLPFFAAFGWLYCEQRFRRQSIEQEAYSEKADFRMRIGYDTVGGGFREPDSDETRLEAEERRNRVKLIACANCGAADPQFDKYYDVVGLLTPAAQYVAHCACGLICKPSTNIYTASWRWRILNENIRFFGGAPRADAGKTPPNDD